MTKRTEKDEADYVAGLRREEPIKTEVIVHLRTENKALFAERMVLLEALVAATEALHVYRSNAPESARRFAASDSHCTPGCQFHMWDTKDGWKKKGPAHD